MESSWKTTQEDPITIVQASLMRGSAATGARFERLLGLALWGVLLAVLFWVGAA